MLVSTPQAPEDFSRIVRRLEKLMVDIPKTDTFTTLQKCSAKLERVKESLGGIDKQKRKELRLTLQKCQELIHRKTILFSKRMEKRSSSPEQQNEVSQRKTLKYCRSTGNLNPNKTLAGGKEISECSEMEVTLNRDQQVLKQQREIDQLREGLNLLREVRGNESLSVLSRLKVKEIEEGYQKQAGMKMREKGLELEEMKGRLKHLQQCNQQLKNRLYNEQRRQEDYISSLRNHLNEANFKLQTSIRDKMRLEEEVSKYLTLCNDQRHDIKVLTQELTLLHKERKDMKNQQLLMMKQSSMKKENERSQIQQKRIRELEGFIAGQKDENRLMCENIEILKKQINQLNEQLTQENHHNQKLREELEVKEEQTVALGQELTAMIELKKRGEMELAETRAAMDLLHSDLEASRQRKNLQRQKKHDSLRQMRDLLTNH